MTEVERIAGQLRRAFEGEAWHGPSVRELLADGLRKDSFPRRGSDGFLMFRSIEVNN